MFVLIVVGGLVSCEAGKNKVASVLSRLVDSSGGDAEKRGVIKVAPASEVELKLRYTDTPMIVLFWAAENDESVWMDSCLGAVERQFPGKVEVSKIDLSKEDLSLDRLGETKPGVMRFYEMGRCIGRLKSLETEAQLVNFVSKWLNKPSDDELERQAYREKRRASQSQSADNSEKLAKRGADGGPSSEGNAGSKALPNKPLGGENTKSEDDKPSRELVVEKVIEVKPTKPRRRAIEIENPNPLPPSMERLRPGEIKSR